MTSRIFKAAALAVTATLAAQGAMGQDVGTRSPDPSTNYSPYLHHDYPDQVLFGDTHLHTAYSADAGLVGATTTPDDAYRFAKGEMVTSSNGETQERVYDVACSDGRTIRNGACDGDVGNTVDVTRATYTNSIGAPFLETCWEDPDFDSTVRAFYYVRVLEIPTPRWTTYDAAFFGIDLPDFVEPTHQERAYTSPIWYNPGS